jgi:SP family general alpha glucoside:H+ symporter-like MFS transporter
VDQANLRLQNLGYMIAASLALSRTSILTKSSYQDLFAIEWCWPALILLFIFFVPESPYYLVMKGQIEQARVQLQKLCGRQEDVDPELRRIVSTYEEEKRLHEGAEAASFLDCFRGTNWRRTRIILYCNGLPQVIGSTFMSNGPYFLVSAGMSPFRVNMMIELGIGFGMFPLWVLSAHLLTCCKQVSPVQ